MKRPLMLLLALVLLMPASASADDRVFRDRDEEPFCDGIDPCRDTDSLDFRRVKHGHGNRHDMVTHFFRMAKPFRNKVMSGKYGISFGFYFDVDSGAKADRLARARIRDGELVAVMTRGRYFDRVVPGRIHVWRPGPRGLKIAFDANLLRDAIGSYRWYVTWWMRGGLSCPGSCNHDYAPDRGWYTHRL